MDVYFFVNINVCLLNNVSNLKHTIISTIFSCYCVKLLIISVVFKKSSKSNMLSACMNWCVWLLVAFDLFASAPSVCLHVSVYFMRLTQVYPWDPYVILTSFARFQIIFTCAWSVKWKKYNWEIQSWEWKLNRKPNLFYLLFSCSLISCSFTWTVWVIFSNSLWCCCCHYFYFVFQLCVYLLPFCVIYWLHQRKHVCGFWPVCIDYIGPRIQYAINVWANFLTVSESSEHQGRAMRQAGKQTYVRWIPHRN